MKRLFLICGMSLVLTGCNYATQIWSPPPAPGQGYGIWTHDDTNNGCNEYNVEPTAETNNQGNLCKAILP